MQQKWGNLFTKNNKLKGFYIPGLEEGPIIAITEEAGKALMSIKYRSEGKAVLPSDNHKAINFLKANGFVETSSKGTRMIKGPSVDWAPQNIYSRIGGNYG